MLVLGLIEVPLWLLLTVGSGIGLYYLGTKNFDHFKKRGIPGPKPWPFVGTAHLLFTMNFYTMIQELKAIHGKTFGLFTGSTLELVTLEEEMISEVTVKQFHNFTNRRNSEMGDPAFDYMLTAIEDEHWKHVRSVMSPAFTTGKLRMMSGEINRGAKTFAKSLASKTEPFEARECAGAFTMDVIASTGFGLRVNVQEDKDNLFIKYGREMATVDLMSLFAILFFLCPSSLPYLTKLGYNVFNPSAKSFFMSVVEQALEGRSDGGNQSRADFIGLMAKAKQGHDIQDKEEEEHGNEDKPISKTAGLKKEEILSNALLFFIAGFDTTSVAVSKLMYQLACNQECQQKLIEEIDSLVGDKDEVDYDTSVKLPYLDQCLNEALRLYPPAIQVDRVAKVDTEVCGVRISKGTVVTIPTYAIHHDPEIWADPEKFDPERFSPENKPNINPFHWMPFGYGPRNCIGMRLALFEVKVAIATILRSHRIMTCEKTQIPLVLSPRRLMHSEKGIWLVLEKRN